MLPNAEDTRKLSHLLRRAGFAARPAEWTEWRSLGVAGATDRLLNPERTPDHLDGVYTSIVGDYIDLNDMDSVRLWWLYRMAHTQRPLEEKMTLFWHNHFATANYKVENSHWMWQQNQLFRTHALANFSTLLKAVSRDPAMLVWLDGEQNRKGTPNENYGRELLELFTMGFGGGYTEHDVREAARAFTGWRFDHDSGEFLFDSSAHDDGPKIFLGETGNFNGDDIIDIVVRQPVTAKFLCTKLFRFFAYDSPSDEDLARPIRAYFDSGYDVRSVVSSILTSQAFYSDQSIMGRVKSPVEYVMSTVRTLDANMSMAGNEWDLANTLRAMGQDLFNPPNVKGWPEGQSWINSMTLLTRMNFGNRVVDQLNWRGDLPASLSDGMNALGVSPRGQAPDMVDALWTLFLPGHPASQATRQALIEYAMDQGSSTPPVFETKAPGLVSLILSSPEYQLA